RDACMAVWLVPDVICRYNPQVSVEGPMFDLPTTLSKCLNLGMALPDVIERATCRPARAMGRPDLGTLKPGSPVDVALFRLEQGDYTFRDVDMAPRKGMVRLVNTLTLVGGEPLPRLPERPRAIWATLPAHQQGILAPESADNADRYG